MKTEFIPKKTDRQFARQKRDLDIYNEYNKLTADKEQSKTVVNKYLMKKYDISSEGTIYVIRRRVEKRLKEEEAAV